MPTLERWMPRRELDRMERRLRRVFEDVGVFPAVVPATDIYETDRDYVFELEVPGFDRGELDVEIFDHTLVVKGDRTAETKTAEGDVLLRERLEREFERRFELPVEADSEHVEATWQKGVLTLHVPKSTTSTAHKVPITT